MLIINDDKSDNQKGKIIFIDASNDYMQSTNQNLLRQEDINKILAAYNSFETIEKYCTISDLRKVEDNDYILNISRYVDTIEPEVVVNIPNVIENMDTLECQRSDSKNNMNNFLMEMKSFQEYNDEIIPKDWEVLLLRDVFEFIPTSSHSKSQMTYDDTESLIYNIHYGGLHTIYKEPLLDFNKYNIPRLTDDAKMPKKHQYLKSGDVVIVDTSEDLNGLTKCVELKNTNEAKVIGGLHTFALRDKSGKTVEGFRAYIFNNYSVKKTIMKYANHSKVYGITKSALGKVPLIIPTINEQQRIGEYLSGVESQIDDQIKKEESIKKELIKLKAGLMQRLCNGKVRIGT